MDLVRAGPGLAELLRMLDVASELRRDRERAQVELDHELSRAALREKLLAAARAAGDAVTEAEVDAAIDLHYARRHRFAEPPRSVAWLFAHAWVRRVGILISVAALAAALAAVSWWSRGGEGRQERRRQEIVASAVARRDAALALATDEVSRRRIAEIAGPLDALASAGRIEAVEAIGADLAGLEARLGEEYEVRIVSRPGELSGIDRRDEEHGGLGYYLIVEAVAPGGTVLERDVTSAEDGRARRVKLWGEKVEPAVWERVAEDKRSDGIVDDRVFAVKRRGMLDEQLRLVDERGAVITRRGQITDW